MFGYKFFGMGDKMLFGRKKKEKEAELLARKKAEILAEKAALQEEIRKLEEERKKLLEAQKPKEPFVVPNMEADDLENYAIKLKAEGRTGDAFACIQKAAEMGSSGSQYKCGEAALENGDFEKAAFWFEKAAEQKHVSAAFELGKIYLFEESKKDVLKAYFWLKTAELMDCRYAELPEYIEKADKEGLGNELSEFAEFYYKVGKMFFEEGVAYGSIQVAKEKLFSAESLGHKKAAELYESVERKLEKNEPYAIVSIKYKGSNAGEQAANAAREHFIKRQFKEAFEFYRFAADYIPEAKYMCAMMLIEGKGIPKDPEGAIFWLEKAAELYLKKAYFPLAELYYGKNTPEALEKAKLWYKKAAECGDLDAKAILENKF